MLVVYREKVMGKGKRKSFEYEPAKVESGQLQKTSGGRATPMAGLVFMAAGLLPLLIGIGVITPKSGSVHSPQFVIAAVGVAFVSAGLAVFLRGIGVSDKSILARIVSLIVLFSFLTPFGWVVFYSDAPLFFRIVFGLGLGLFVFLFSLSVLLTRFPSLQKRLNIKVVENGESAIDKRRGS